MLDFTVGWIQAFLDHKIPVYLHIFLLFSDFFSIWFSGNKYLVVFLSQWNQTVLSS